MEAEGGFGECFPDLIFESSANSPAANNSFDCNICLDFVSDPVVTLCGHLYCWPCIYRWLHLSSINNPPRLCPVCKSPLSDSSLVPLYGRGLAGKPHGRSIGIPRRPTDNRSLLSAAAVDQCPYSTGILRSTAGVVLGEIAFAILPWAFANPPCAYLWPAAMGESTPRRRRIEIWLHQFWVFLLCCTVLCLLFF